MKSIKLNSATTVIDEEKFVKSHQDIIEFNKGKDFIAPYQERLDTYLEIKRKEKEEGAAG